MASKDLTWRLFGEDVTASRTFKKVSDDMNKSSKSVSKDADAAASSVQGLGTSAAEAAPHFPLLAAAAVGGLALIGPAAGAATAGVVALGATAAVGVLAFKGVQNEIKNGTADGLAFKAQFEQVGDTISGLEGAAEKGIRGGLLGSLQQVNAYLPTLKPLVSGLAHDLGNALSIGTGGLVQGLKTASPLLKDAGGYAEEMAAGFAHFTASSQFKQFVDYSEKELPRIGTLLGTTGKAVVDIGTALQPLGDEAVDNFTKFGHAVDSVHLDKLGDIFSWFHKNNSFANLALDPKGSAAALNVTLADGTKVSQDQLVAQQALAKQYGTTSQAILSVNDAEAKNALSLAATTYQMQAQNNAVGLLSQSMQGLNGDTLGVEQAQTQVNSATAAVVATFKTNGTTLDQNTSKGLANVQALQSQASAALALRTQTAQQTGSTEKANAALAASKSALEGQLSKMHELTPAIQAYIDKLFAVPPVKKTKIDLSLDSTAAFNSLNAFLQYTNSQSATVRINALTGGSRLAGNASGGSLPEGYSTINEQGWEVVHKQGSSVQVFSHSDSVKMLPQGPSVPAFASGTRAQQSAAKSLQSSQISTGGKIAVDIPSLLAKALGTPAALAAALKKLITDVTAASTKGMTSNNIVSTLTKENSQLLNLAAKRKYAAAQIKAGNQNLAAAEKAYTDEKTSVAGGVTSGFGLTNINGAVNANQIITQLQQRVAAAGQFSGGLASLQKSGLSKALVNQLGEAGVDSAGGSVAALLKGSKADLSTINSLFAQDQKYGNAAGTLVANNTELAGVNSAKAFVKGWTKEEASLTKAASSLARKMAGQTAANVHLTVSVAQGTEAAAGRAIITSLEKYLGHKVKL